MYPKNLVDKLMKDAGIHEEWVPDEDHITAYNNMVAELSDQEREFLEAHYRDGVTIQELGERYGMTREVARRVILNVGRKLRNPLRMKWIIDGERERQKYFDAWDKRIKDTQKAITEDDGISELGLSRRSLNALTRWFWREPSIKELNELGEKELKGVRNLGTVSIAEIKDSLDRFYGR